MGIEVTQKRVSGYMRVDKISDFVEAKAVELMARAQACMSNPSKHMQKKYRYKRVTFALTTQIVDER
jgi:predicted XRE-type DNA-binding protein